MRRDNLRDLPRAHRGCRSQCATEVAAGARGAASPAVEEKSGKLEEAIQVEEKLASLSSAIEQIQGEVHVLETRVSRSTITVSINEPGAVGSSSETISGRLGSAVDAGVSGLVSLTNILISAFILLLPLMVGTVLPYDLALRPLRRRAAQRKPAAADRDARSE